MSLLGCFIDSDDDAALSTALRSIPAVDQEFCDRVIFTCIRGGKLKCLRLALSIVPPTYHLNKRLNPFESTPLNLAASVLGPSIGPRERYEMMRLLLEHGACPNFKEWSDGFPLDCAAHYLPWTHFTDCATLLVDYGAYSYLCNEVTKTHPLWGTVTRRSEKRYAAIELRKRCVVYFMLWAQRACVLPLALTRWMLKRHLYDTERHTWKLWIRV